MSAWKRDEKSLSFIIQSPTSCQQCEEHVQVINLWEVAVRSVAKNFLAIQKELIKAESYTSRLSEHFVDIHRERVKTDSDQELHKSGTKGSSFTRRKGKSEGLCTEEEPSHLLMCLSKTLREASMLCRKGAVGCFETGTQPAQRGSVKRGGCTGASPKRHSLQELTPHRQNGPLTLSKENEHTFESVDSTLPVREPHPSQDVPHPSQDGSFLINRSSVRSSGSSSDGDGNDHTHILEKLRSLEDERDRLLQEIDKQRKENLKTRQSLAHTWNNLENQNIQLAMALQDLSVATSEIKKASNLQTQLNELEQEKQQLLERLEYLEDESSCVKLSLVQLLQEKSAYSKHLELENTRLLEAFQQGRAISPPSSNRDSTSSGGKSPPSDDITDNLGRSPSLTEEEVLVAIGDISDIPVHKQGFMVKEGGRVKSWKKRLFVLNSIGLYYYKTDAPAGCIRIDEMMKVDQCKNRTNTFQIATPNRNYHCIAPNQDEMHSWIGMLEALRQHKIMEDHTRSSSYVKSTDSTSGISGLQLSFRTVDIPRTRTKRSPHVDRKSKSLKPRSSSDTVHSPSSEGLQAKKQLNKTSSEDSPLTPLGE